AHDALSDDLHARLHGPRHIGNRIQRVVVLDGDVRGATTLVPEEPEEVGGRGRTRSHVANVRVAHRVTSPLRPLWSVAGMAGILVIAPGVVPVLRTLDRTGRELRVWLVGLVGRQTVGA